MGIVRTMESKKREVEEFRRVLVKCGSAYPSKKVDKEVKDPRRKEMKEEEEEDEEKLVCVTSGLSYLGLAVVNCLLYRGYSVRIAVDNEEDIERLREMEIFKETRGSCDRVLAVMVKVTDIESLIEAFAGCRGVFHTSAFVDPAGLAGYTKYMADLEVKASENVVLACARTESVQKCVFTSSLLACVWRDYALHNVPPIVDHNCWSEESITESVLVMIADVLNADSYGLRWAKRWQRELHGEWLKEMR